MYKKKPQNDPDVKLSKALSWLLRHGAASEGVKISPDGYVRLSDVLDYFKHGKGYNNLKVEHIMHIVDSNDKKRFEVKQDIDGDKEEKVWWIRATQGHSMGAVKTEELLTPIEDPTKYPVVIHGTYRQFWPAIEKEGLKRMTRLHIHFAPGHPKENGVISGMRGSCDLIIEIDMEAAMKDGIKFYISSNNVILT